MTDQPLTPMVRNLVIRGDGKQVNIAPKTGQIFVCLWGCCCGRVQDGYAAVPLALYQREWERRRLRSRVHLTESGCLGPCPLANVVLVVFDGRSAWFHSISSEKQVVAIFDYVDAMLAANAWLPPPPALTDYAFQAYDWELARARAHGELPEVRRLPTVQPGILVLTHADTDLLLIEKVRPRLPREFPPLRAANLRTLRTAADVDAFAAAELPSAGVVVLRLHGGRPSFLHGFDRLRNLCERQGIAFIAVPGPDEPDAELTAASTVPPDVVHQVFAYLQRGGPRNVEQLLRFLADHLLFTGVGFQPPAEEPRAGVYHRSCPEPGQPTIGILFYRAHLLAGNLDPVDELIAALERHGAGVIAVYAYSLKELDEHGLPVALSHLVADGAPLIDALIVTMSFAMGSVNPDGPTLSTWAVEPLERLDVPVIQAITAGMTRETWEASTRGLSPLDVAMNVALPEFDGRIISAPISFKDAPEGSEVFRYVAVPDRVERVAGLALRLAKLRRTPNAEKRIAFVLTNSTQKAVKVGNAVGLDAGASLLVLLEAMRAAGYRVEGVPDDPDQLMHELIDRCAYDSELFSPDQLARVAERVPTDQYRGWLASLPEPSQRQMTERWGAPPGEAYLAGDAIGLPGLQFGNVFIALQPSRGYGIDPNAIYHVPDLPPPHYYYAFYRWLRDGFGADAIVHVGKHGTLEWLPGKGVGLSAACFPDAFLADLPLIYPFIINDPGEGTQAKRRAHAIIIDHLTPPLTDAGAYGELAELAQLVDEYYQVETSDPAKLPLLQNQIWQLIQQANLDSDVQTILNYDSTSHVHDWEPTVTEDGTPVSLTEMRAKDFAHLIENIDGYLCELTGAQIRGGLHILGRVPEGEQLVDLVAHLVRLPNLDVPSLRGSVATALGYRLDELLESPGKRLARARAGEPATAADAIEMIDTRVLDLLRALAGADWQPAAIPEVIASTLGDAAPPEVATVLRFVCDDLIPKLRRTADEIANVLRALDGRYVPPGPSGAPSRGMAHVLPTGRNFYAVDPRTLPSVAAWQVGERLAHELLERYRAETGSYPEQVGISVWGTTAMRTHGDDIAQVFALLGVRPRWQAENRRLIGVEPLPLAELGRPRIDVVLRISGFFRDAFPHLIRLIDEAITLVADLDEPPEQNYVRKHLLAEEARRQAAGEPTEPARFRIFGPKPAAYGTGLLPLIESRNWTTDEDLAAVYIEWGGYAYTASRYGLDAREELRRALAGVQVAVINQDNRETDIFDADDYFQWHGGMVAAIRALSGAQPKAYFGDSHDPARARVRDLKEEAKRVFRSRVVNPKWIRAMEQHGFKGALELAATVDYLFGYDATANVIEDWMYERLTAAYLLDRETRAFLERSNPWALHAIAERLLEAVQRGLWEQPNPETLAALREIYLAADAALEGRAEPPTSAR